MLSQPNVITNYSKLGLILWLLFYFIVHLVFKARWNSFNRINGRSKVSIHLKVVSIIQLIVTLKKNILGNNNNKNLYLISIKLLKD